MGIVIAALVLFQATEVAASGLRDRQADRRSVAVVNGIALLQNEFDRLFSRARDELNQQTPNESVLNTLRSEVLNQMIERELLYQVAADVVVDEQEIDREIESLRGRFESDEAFENMLQEDNIDVETLHDSLRRSFAIQRHLEDTVFPTASVENEEVRSFYDANLDLFEQSGQVAARHILISTREITEEAQRREALERTRKIRRDLLNGADFDRLAREHSEGPSSTQGGDLGVFGRGQMVAPFEEAAFRLAIGEISEIVETQFGYHIIQVTEQLPVSVIAFADAEEDIRGFLLRQKLDEVVQEYIESLRSEADIVIHLDLG